MTRRSSSPEQKLVFTILSGPDRDWIMSTISPNGAGALMKYCISMGEMSAKNREFSEGLREYTAELQKVLRSYGGVINYQEAVDLLNKWK